MCLVKVKFHKSSGKETKRSNIHNLLFGHPLPLTHIKVRIQSIIIVSSHKKFIKWVKNKIYSYNVTYKKGYEENKRLETLCSWKNTVVLFVYFWLKHLSWPYRYIHSRWPDINLSRVKKRHLLVCHLYKTKHSVCQRNFDDARR